MFSLSYVYYYSAPVGISSILINLSVCLWAYLWNHWTNLHEMCCTDPLWPWLGPPLAALRYITVLWMTSHLAVMGRIWRCVEGWTFNLLPLAPSQYRGRVWCPWMPRLVWSQSVSWPRNVDWYSLDVWSIKMILIGSVYDDGGRWNETSKEDLVGQCWGAYEKFGIVPTALHKFVQNRKGKSKSKLLTQVYLQNDH